MERLDETPAEVERQLEAHPEVADEEEETQAPPAQGSVEAQRPLPRPVKALRMYDMGGTNLA